MIAPNAQSANYNDYNRSSLHANSLFRAVITRLPNSPATPSRTVIVGNYAVAYIDLLGQSEGLPVS